MNQATREVAILIVAYQGRQDLDACLTSILASEDPGITKHIVVVDNGSGDGTVEFLATAYPGVACVASSQNLGFAGGNNLGWDYIQQRYPDTPYVALLNQDTLVTSGWLAPLLAQLEQDPGVGCVQPKLKLYPDTALINTVGNRSHFLGFGFMTAYGERDDGRFDAVRAIDFPSGAALVTRSELLRRLGLFDAMFFLYLEDVDLGWKIRQAGLTIQYVPASVVYHKYAFKHDYRYYYYLERNRLWLLLVYYRLATLGLLAPAILLMECGQLGFALLHGRLGDKLRSYAFFLRPASLRRLWQQRRTAQRSRRVGDAEFLRRSLGTVDFPEVAGFLVRWVFNPVLGGYWQIAKRLIFW